MVLDGFLDQLKYDRQIQAKTLVTGVLAITGFSLFCVEMGRSSYQKRNFSVVNTFNMHEEKEFEHKKQLPIVTVCPVEPSFNNMDVSCTYFDGSEHTSVPVTIPQPAVTINSLGDEAREFHCKHINADMKLQAGKKGEYLKCEVTGEAMGPGGFHSSDVRVTAWGDKKVWPGTVIDHPLSDTYAWKSVHSCTDQEIYMEVFKLTWKSHQMWWHELHHGQRFDIPRPNCVSEDTPTGMNKTFSKFSLGYDPLGFLNEMRVETLYTTNQALGVCGGIIFFLMSLNAFLYLIINAIFQGPGGNGLGAPAANGGQFQQLPDPGAVEKAPATGTPAYGSL